MAEKTPVRVNFDNSGNPTGFAELQSSEYVGLDDGGTGGSYASLAALLEGLGLGTSDAPTFAGLQTSGNLTVGGNLQVDGTTTTVNSTTVTVDDPIFTLGGDTAPASDDNKDRGIEFRYHNGTTAKLGFFGFDDSTGKFIFIPDATNAAEVFSGTAGTIVANLEGNVTGTVSSLSGLTTDDLTEGSSNFYATNERIDDRVNALIIGGAGVDTAYDDSAGTLTLTADLSEVTADLNERIDDQVNTLLTDATTSGIDISYDDSGNELTLTVDLSEITEAFTDKVGGMVSGGTESFIDVAYDDTNDRLDFTVATKDEDDMASDSNTHLPTQQSVKAYVDTETANVASDTMTFTNKTFDVEGTGNSISNIDVADFKSGVLDTDISSVSGSDDTLASAKAIKTYVDAQIATEDTLAELNDTNITSPADGALLFYDNDNSVWIDNVVSGDITIADTGVATIASGAVDNDMLAGSIANAKLANSTMTVGGVTLTLGATDATPAFDLSDATGLPTTSLTGTITNAQLAGSIANSKLANSSIAIGGVTFNLGDTDATPALDLSDATNYPTTSLDGTITNAQLAGSIANSKLANSSITVTDGSNSTATALGGTITFSGTSNEIEVAESSGTITIGLPNDVTIAGNLTVSGTTTTVDSTTVTIDDPMVRYADNNSGNSVDFGFYGKYVQSATTKFGGLIWDASQSDKFRLFHGLQTEPTTTVDISATGHTVGTLIANIEGDVTGNLTGNVTGNVSGSSGSTTGNAATATALASAQNFSLTGDVTASAVSFDGTGAVALSTTVTQSAVTQHQAALSITESQISDLQSYLTAETNDLSSAVTWANVPDANITQSSVTQHQAALSITESQISDLGSYITATSTDTLTGKTINFEDNTAIIEFAVTVSNASGNNKYYIDGELSANIQLIPGVTYRFDQSHSSNSGHPLVLSTTSESAGVTSYTTGVTTSGTPGSSGAYTQIVVDGATADKLYYYCSNHSGMGGGIVSIQGSSFVAGTGISISGETISSTITQYADSDVASYLTANNYATQSYVQTQVSNVIDAAPGALDTLNELAAAIGDDANFSTTITNSIATKLATADFTSTANTWLGTKDTDDLSEGSSNLYYTDARVQSYLSGGNGITMSGSGAFSVDATVITGQTAETSNDNNDLILIYDDSASALRKMTRASFLAGTGAGSMSNFTVAGDSGSSQQIADGNTFTIAGGTNLSTVASATDTITINLDTETIQDIVGAMLVTNGSHTGISFAYDDANDGAIDATVTATGTVTEAFKTIAVSGQNNVVADSATDTLTFAAGANITLTTNDSTDTVTIAATGGAANAFSTLAVSGQSNVVADSETDTLTFVEGTGMTITTDASTDTITFTSSGSGGGGTMPFTSFDGSTDNIILSSAATGGALPVTLAGGTSDPINMTGTTQTLTSYADDDGDTKVEVERTSDNDTVHIKAGGTDVITATSSGVTITNLTVTGTTTQANELKITDTLFELNADGGSLTTDAGMIVERGSTGDNAAFIWDESTDSWVAGTTATDGSAAANLTVTEGTLKAATQSQGDNSTNVATTAYVDTATAGISSDSIKDADNDTKIEAEASSDADELVFTTGGQERAKMDNNMSMSARGGFFTHNLAMHASETFTIASTEGTVAAGPLDIQGTVDVQGSLVVL